MPIETVKAAIAMPMIASLIGERFLLEISVDKINATTKDESTHPANIPNSPKVKIPAAVAAKNIAAPPPMPNRFGSPNELRVDSWIKTPASPSEDPVTRAVAILGILMSQETILEMFLSSDSNSPVKISFALMSVGPANRPNSTNKAEKISRKQYVVQYFKLFG